MEHCITTGRDGCRIKVNENRFILLSYHIGMISANISKNRMEKIWKQKCYIYCIRFGFYLYGIKWCVIL